MHPEKATEETIFQRITRLIGLYILTPLLLLLALPVAVHISQKPDFGIQVRNLEIILVEPGSPGELAGVRQGDRLLAISGEPVPTMVDYYSALAGRYELQPVIYSLQRTGGVFEVQVFPRPPSRAGMIKDYSLWFAGLTFLLMGWWVLSKRRDAVSRDFFGLCFIFALFLAEIPDLPSTAYLTIKNIILDLTTLLWPVFFLRFFLNFPSEGTLAPRRKRRLRMLFLPVVPLFLLSLYTLATKVDPTTSTLLHVVQKGAFILFMVYFLSGLFIFARKVLSRDRPIQHTKMRVILFGLVIGLTPFLISTFVHTIIPHRGIPFQEWFGFSLLLVPICFGLAILRYGALDTAFVIRVSLIYLALTLGLVLVYFIVVVGLGQFFTSLFGVSSTPLTMITIAGCALWIVPFRRKFQLLVDQAFYPSRQANREAIEDLGQELSGLLDTQNAAETLLSRLAHLYRPERLSLFLSEEGDKPFMQEVACVCEGSPVRPVFTLEKSSPLVAFLNRVRRPVFSEEFDGLPDLLEEGPDSASFLSRLGSQLLVPLVTGNQLFGFLAFGPKGSGAFYSQEDLANLRFMAIQAAALLESRKLYQESLARKQLETELTVAQGIQAQLLPVEPLVLPEIRVCGRMDSSQEVGGDYFDYFRLDSRNIGFAIADVAGKGIPAALQMTTLRANFRSEATRHQAPNKVVACLNQTIDSLKAGQFISFFYGTFSRTNNLLRYCNAGMNPPVLFRKNKGFVEPLKRGGPVLGVRHDHHYRIGTLKLEKGDLLMLYTDGLTEQTNQEGEFFELERLMAIVKVNIENPIDQLRETIFSTVSQFGGLTPSDDRTVMLLKFS